MNIYVSNLSFNVQDEDLREFFTEYGEVSSAKVITDKFTGKSRGFGFVEMPDDEAARKAIAELDNGTVEGRTIKVMEANQKKIVRPALAVAVVFSAMVAVATKAAERRLQQKQILIVSLCQRNTAPVTGLFLCPVSCVCKESAM